MGIDARLVRSFRGTRSACLPLHLLSVCLLAACDANLQVMTTPSSDFPEHRDDGSANEDTNSPKAVKLSADLCIDPELDKVSKDTSLMLCNGEMAQGQLDLSNLVAGNIKAGVTVAGTLGTHGPACAADGASNCLVDGATYLAAAKANAVADNIKAGVPLAGVTGNYPSASARLAGADGTSDLDSASFNSQIASSATFEWFDSAGNRYTRTGDTNLKAGLINPGVSIFGVAGASAIGVRHFETTAFGTSVHLAWEPSGSPHGFIIVRRSGAPVSWTPTPGTQYNSGTAVDADHTVVVKATAGQRTATDTITSGGIYSYQIFAFNSDFGYSQATLKDGVGSATCGAPGDGCYASLAATAAGHATTPGGKPVEYVMAGGGFYVWKEVGGERILRPNGLDLWAEKLNANGKGQSGLDFTDYRSLVGRACPPQVYLDDSNKTTTDNCLYYAISDVKAPYTGDHYNGSDWSTSFWYQNNQPLCSARGMRSPTLHETDVSTAAAINLPNAEGSRTFAGANGVPSAGAQTWTATAHVLSFGDAYWTWDAGTAGIGRYSSFIPVRCVLP